MFFYFYKRANAIENGLVSNIENNFKNKHFTKTLRICLLTGGGILLLLKKLLFNENTLRMARHPNIIAKWNYDEIVHQEGNRTLEERKKSARRGEDAPPGIRLQELKKSEFQVAGYQPDTSGWKVVDTTGKDIGIVQDLLFDHKLLKMRYIIISLKEGLVSEEYKNILAPVGKARLDIRKKLVEIPGANQEKLLTLPTYKSTKSLARTDEKKIQEAFAGTNLKADKENEYSAEEFYNHPDFDEDSFYSTGQNNED